MRARTKRPLAIACQEIASTWINGNRSDAVAEVSNLRLPRRESVALTAGVLRVLANQFGDETAADFAATLTRPFGGHQ